MSNVWMAFRVLRKQPAYALVAILTLAIAVAGATAIFSVLDAVVLRPLPFPDADRLVLIRDAAPPRFPEFSLSPGRFLEWQARTHVFDAIAATRSDTLNLTGRGDPRRLVGADVSSTLFAVAGLAPIKGRVFTADEDRPGAPRVAVVSEALSHSLFDDSQDNVIGQVLLLDDKPTTIVGVMPAGFTLPNNNVQIWLPLALTERERQTYGSHYLACFARMKPGMTVETARQDLARASREIEELNLDGYSNRGWTTMMLPLQEAAIRSVRRGIIVLACAVALVLLIACANVANLLLARGIGRQREIGVRAALGATRGRLIRQMLIENLVVAVVACVAGLGGAIAIVRWIVSSPTANLPRASSIAINATTLTFALALAALTPIVFGLLPALQASRANLTSLLGDRTGSNTPRAKTRAVLIVAEVALAVVLVEGSALLIRSFDRLVHVSPGFDPENAIVVTVSLPDVRYSDNARKAAFWATLDQRASALPGVDGAGLAQAFPLISDHVGTLDIPGKTPEDPTLRPSTNFYAVTPGYFKAMGITLLRGRLIQTSDMTGGERVSVISQSLANRWFAGEDPIGKRIHVSQGPSNDGSRIVGVVGDIKQYGLDTPTTLQVYEPVQQHPYFGGMLLVVRTSHATADATAELRALLKELDPSLPIGDARRVSTILDRSVGPRRLTAILLGWFAGVALLLSTIGVFGLVSFMIAQRTQEIGIRVALGAAPSRVLALVFRQGLSLTALGAAIGIVAGVWTAGLLRAELFDVSPRDPLAMAIAPLSIVIASALACYWPARRALRVDPVTALRQT
jgi:putative ABC transport system permease protein